MICVKMKYLFIDMDGVLAEYNVRGSVILDNWFEPDIFLKMQPVQPVINKLYELSKSYDISMFILSASPSQEATNEKIVWLVKNVPFIPKINWYFVGETKRKLDYLDEICYNIDRSDVYLLEDNHDTLVEAEQRGYNAIHISTFLARDIFKERDNLI